jgi:hypothetical protein
MTLESLVSSPCSLLVPHSMILSVSLWFHIHISKLRELRGRSEFAKNTFSVLSIVTTHLTDSDVMCYVTSHNLVKDLHVFGSYVTGHLSRTPVMSWYTCSSAVIAQVTYTCSTRAVFFKKVFF